MKKPTTYTTTKGKAVDKNRLNSIDKALLSADIGNYNLIKVSSILPKECLYKPQLPKKPSGTLLPTILSIKTSQKKGEIASSAIAIAKGKDIKVVAEASNNRESDITENEAERKAKKMLKNRNQKTKSIKSFSIQNEVKETTTVVTAVILGGFEENE